MIHYRSSLNPPFIEATYLRSLSICAADMDIRVILFSPLQVKWEQGMVEGYQYDGTSEQWKSGLYPLPQLLYDRIDYDHASQLPLYRRAIRRLLATFGLTLLGKGLPSKWRVYQLLKQDPQLSPFLPETHPCNLKDIKVRLLQGEALCLKPASGSNGKGVMKLFKKDAQFMVKGRSLRNRSFTKQDTQLDSYLRWLKQVIANRRYIMQPYLSLSTPEGLPFDLRLLVQKKDDGQWHYTGSVIRCGRKRGITSNIRGGGKAMKAISFLKKHYNDEQLKHIKSQVIFIYKTLPTFLESQHGSLLELGIDMGIDSEGKVWILEVNSKPGRSAFYLARETHMYNRSLISPLQYARYMYTQLGGQDLA
jgi:hypothetical protein